LLGCAQQAASETPPQPVETTPNESAAPASETPASETGRRVAPGGEPAQGVCGGFAGDTCTKSEYCAYEAGQYCGAADASSVCKPRPENCTMQHEPVCGCDQKVYSNACQAAAAGTGVLNQGECQPQE